jgi:hypothetical protein
MRSVLWLIRSLLSRARFEREMREELAQHVQHRADDLVRAGMPPDEAVRQARVEFGAVEAYKEQCRDASGFASLRVLHGFGGDLRLALRRLLAAPVFTIFAVVSLAVGLGVTTAAYSVVANLFFAPSGVADEHRVVVLATRWEGNLVSGGISRSDYEDVRAAQTSFSSLTASAGLDVSVATPTSTDLMKAEAVDGHYFDTLGSRPVLGRAIDAQDISSRHDVVVLSHALWTLRFSADPSIIGRELYVAGRPFEVVGIAAEGFYGREDPPDRYARVDPAHCRPSEGSDDGDRAGPSTARRDRTPGTGTIHPGCLRRTRRSRCRPGRCISATQGRRPRPARLARKALQRR